MTVRPLGTMVIYGFPERELDAELDIALGIGASVLEILPDWSRFPDPELVRNRGRQIGDSPSTVRTAAGEGGPFVRPASTSDRPIPPFASESVDDLKACVDWLETAGGVCLVVHPGGLSIASDFSSRRDALAQGLIALARHATDTGVTICVENMPPGVHPGSRMADLADLLIELNDPSAGPGAGYRARQPHHQRLRGNTCGRLFACDHSCPRQ